MSIREYTGARYVPIFGRKDEDSIEWDNSKPYEPLTIVLYQGNSFTSRQYVPAGIDINNEQYWASTGIYNAQVEQYRQEVRQFDGRITANAEGIEALNEGLETFEGTTNAAIEAANTAIDVTSAELSEFEATANAAIEANAKAIEDKEIASITDPVIAFVNAATGSDENDGSEETPFATFDRAVRYLASKTIAGNIIVTGPGEYKITPATIVGGQKHIVSRSQNVRFVWDEDDLDNVNAFYGGYLNFSGYETDNLTLRTRLEIRGSAGAYLEGCKGTLVNLDIYSESYFGFIGANSTVTNCRFFCPVNVSISKVIFSSCEFNPGYNNYQTAYGVNVYNRSDVTFSGANVFNYSGSNLSTAVVRAGNSELFIGGNYPVNGTFSIHGYHIDYTTLKGTPERVGNLLGRDYTYIENAYVLSPVSSAADKHLITASPTVGTRYGTPATASFIYAIVKKGASSITGVFPRGAETADYQMHMADETGYIHFTQFANGDIRLTSNSLGADSIKIYAM